MKRGILRRVTTVVLAALFAVPGVWPVPVLVPAVPAAAATTAKTVDLEQALSADGSFVGAEHLDGAIDTQEWSLVSDLASGEPPRFAPATESANLIDSAGNEWLSYGSNGVGNGALNATVRAMLVSDISLVVAGDFTNAAGLETADYIARWDGYSWTSFGSNGSGDGALNGPVNALVGYKQEMYVGGAFTNAGGVPEADFVARWTGGDVWTTLGTIGTGVAPIADVVRTLVVWDLYLLIGGDFEDAAGLGAADYVVRWDGFAWIALGSNGAGDGALNGAVRAAAVSGDNVYIGGAFTNVGGTAQADYVARWNGAAWSALGSNGAGDGALNGQVHAVAVSGSDVYVGGAFTNAAGVAQADFLARWNGAAWSALGSNGAGNGALNNTVNVLAVWGTNIFVGGAFTNVAGTAPADYVARWNGTGWSALGSNGAGNGTLTGNVHALTISSSTVYIGGAFINAAGIPTADYFSIAITPGPWSALSSNGAGNGALSGEVLVTTVWGGDLYVGGLFTDVAGISEADYLARWDGSRWSAVGSNGAGDGALNHGVAVLYAAGSVLYVGGFFANAAGIPEADYLARWNGSAWSAVGSDGAGDGALNSAVRGLALLGGYLYAGGQFTDAAGNSLADYVARWNGSAWSAVGSSGGGYPALFYPVTALAVLGNDLYIGGSFVNAGGISAADNIARWNGSAWSALGSGAGNGPLDHSVHTLFAYGGHLYVGGAFSNAGGVAAADGIARWNGDKWSALGSNGALNGTVYAVTAAGGDIYVGGGFTNAAGLSAADHVARWNGAGWSALGSDGASDGALNRAAFALSYYDGDLVAGGSFENANGIPMADWVAAHGPLGTYKPDGRIRKGSGALVGNNVYNADGTNQTRTGKAAIGSTITFTISIQNDGQPDRFRLWAAGATATNYRVRYFAGLTNVTDLVVAGTYQTPRISRGSTFAIKVKVKVLTGAAAGSSVTRLVRITSESDQSKIDAIKFVARRG